MVAKPVRKIDDDVWYESDDDEEFEVEEFDITSTPNDFNVSTIYHFIKSGAVKIPGFQRNYVWDIVRASKLIESLLLGLPVPQIFLYEDARNSFLVIDGQQRLMSIYYFMEQRFPKKEVRSDLRDIFDKSGQIPREILHDDKYFVPFKLTFRERTHTRENRFQGKYYESLGEYKTRFDLRPIRNIIVRQNSSDDDSAIYEIFNRLNSGGVNLRPQEIRASLYHSAFYDMLHHINADPAWRRLVGRAEPDLHGKDLEILLRGFAMLEDGDNYAPSMIKFLNQFSLKRKKTKPENNEYLENLFKSFLHACSDLPDNVFFTERSRRFNIALYDAVFSVVCRSAFSNKQLIDGKIEARSVRNLEVDSHFIAATRYGTTKTVNVKTRMERAKTLIKMI